MVNTAAVKQYEGLKHGGDFSDARHLAHMLQLGILPTGYIYPREQRALRELLRKRSQLVHQRSAQILSIENLVARNLGAHIGGNEVKRLDDADVDAMELLEEQKLALKSVSGVGVTLALTIALKTRDISRFASPGDFASYARTVDSRRESNAADGARAGAPECVTSSQASDKARACTRT